MRTITNHANPMPQGITAKQVNKNPDYIMQTITRKSMPTTVFSNRELFHYSPILSIVADIYRTPDDIIQHELRKEKRKAIKVNVDGHSFIFTTTAEIEPIELTAD